MSPEPMGRLVAGGPALKQLLTWTGSADSRITSEAVTAMAEKFNLWKPRPTTARSREARSRSGSSKTNRPLYENRCHSWLGFLGHISCC